uniref:AAA+ ATPase domain-containing protein n=1 Tax=Leersia perrieri TaxID=77586 RepID=A0A0D9XR42_9ORYZ
MAGALVSVSTGVMESLLCKLSSMLEKEYAKKKAIEKDVLFLRNELSSMNAVMQKYAILNEPDLQVKTWMKEVREVAYDIEDIIDAFMARNEKFLEPTGIRGFIINNILKLKELLSSRTISQEIEELKNQVLEVNDRRKRYKLDVSLSMASSESIDPRLPAFYSEVGGLVGIDGPRDKIIELLREEAPDEDGGFVNQLKIVSITGFGGLGKTTLAKQVYQKIKWQFDCTAFVFVSQMPDIKRILLDLVSGLGFSGNMLDDERQLIDRIREFLHDKRYFIVIDDIWSISAWEILKCVLPGNNSGSRVIITTRNLDIAMICCSTFKGSIYRITPLSENDSRRLFYKRIFHGGHSCPTHLEELSKAILRKCGGLPLAILHIASLLATKSNTKEEWELVLYSLGSALENSHTLKGLKKILLLSFYDLPPHLKTCLLYLSIYPEDYMINSRELIRKWIAEGFIAEDRCKRLDQVGQSYFNDLINRSMILPMDNIYDGGGQYCQVHDLVLNIIRTISEEDNFVTIIDGHKSSSFPEKIRRLYLQFNDSKDAAMPDNITNKNCIRSFGIFGFEFIKQVPNFTGLQSLRVLDLGYCTLLENHHIECLGSMLQLRYLVLHSRNVTELPDQIGNLQHLEMLDVTLCSIQELPETIVQLQKLVFLYVSITTIIPERIGTMQCLEELCHISSNSIRLIGDLKCLTKLRDLSIAVGDPVGTETYRLQYRETLLSSLSELGRNNLQSLTLNYKGNENFILDSSMGSCFSTRCLRKFIIWRTLSRVPEWMSIFDNLIHLEMSISRMEKSDINILKGISTLCFLRLVFTGHAPNGRIIIDNQGFPALKELFLLCFIPGVWPLFAPGAMQKLQKYHLTFKLQKLKCNGGVLDFGLQHLSRLQHMSVVIIPSGSTCDDTLVAENAIRSATSIHLNQPTVEIFVQ